MANYIVLGFTAGRCSIDLINRYKGPEELRDIFIMSQELLGRAARRRLYIFEVCEELRPECLYLISFDIKLVKPINTQRARRESRKPSHEYTEIKEMMYYSLCLGGKDVLDNSTYICFEDKSLELENYLSKRTDPDKFKVESYVVKPFRYIEKELIINGLNYILTWLEAKALALASDLRNPRKRCEKRTKDFLELVPTTLAIKVVKKLRGLGIEQEQIEQILLRLNATRKIVEDAFREREQMKIEKSKR